MTDRKRILIVEDDRSFRMMLNLLLKRAGYDVAMAENGLQGLEIAQHWQPNLILVDWMMPVMTGLEMCRALRQIPALLHVYVILLTAKSSTEDVITGLDEGADDYLIKPLSNGELLARIRAGLRIQEMQAHLAIQYAAAARDRARLEAVLSSAGEAIVVLDEKGRIESLNKTAQALLGKYNNLKEGNYLADLNQEDLQTLLRRAQSNGNKATAGEITLNNGNTYTAQLTPIDTGEGKGWVATFQDITHLIQLDRLKTQALQHVAHDIKSPLTQVRGFVEAMAYLGPLNEEQIDAQKSALRGADLISSLVSGLLNLEKIEAGIIERQALDLAAMVQEIVKEFRWQASDRNIDLSFQELLSLPEVMGDSLQLGQAVRNLLDNALKYTPAGGSVKVSIWREGTQAMLAIADTGAGVPPDALPHLFDRFYRVPGQKESNGSGLGLAIVKSVVEAHGGYVWAESLVDKGTTFYISLPIPADPSRIEVPLAIQRPPRHPIGRPAHVYGVQLAAP